MTHKSSKHYIYYDGASWICTDCDIVLTDNQLITALKKTRRITPHIPAGVVV